MDAPQPTVLGGIAAILSAVAWPVTALCIGLSQRKRLAGLLEILTAKLSKAERVKLGSFEIENEINQTVAAIAALPPVEAHENQVPQEQLEVAKRFQEKVDALDTDEAAAVAAVANTLREFAREYESTRDQMEPGQARTMAMNRIVTKMRAIAGKAGPLLPEFVVSDSAGLRLAAIAVLQVAPEGSYARWLGERPAVETPFVFYQASVALLQMASNPALRGNPQLRAAIHSALETIHRVGGPPDKNTVSVLTAALQRLGQ